MRDLGESADLVWAINGSRFGRLREREHRRAHVMRAAPLPLGKLGGECLDRYFASLPGEPDELEAAAEEFRRPTFVGRDVRFRMAQHRPPGRRQVRERERIGRRSGRHEKNGNVALEQLREFFLDTSGPGVVAVGQRRPVVRARNGGENFRRDRRRIIAGEIHAGSRHYFS